VGEYSFSLTRKIAGLILAEMQMTPPNFRIALIRDQRGPHLRADLASYFEASCCLANSVRKSCSFCATNFL